jgi:hypothetical protein
MENAVNLQRQIRILGEDDEVIGENNVAKIFRGCHCGDPFNTCWLRK